MTSLSVTERGSFHVKLEWQEPVDKNGIIINYVIDYRMGELAAANYFTLVENSN